jgi:hypothetical protein
VHRGLHGRASAAQGMLACDFHEKKITDEDKTIDGCRRRYSIVFFNS